MACIPLSRDFHDGGRYVGGDLAAQIADRAVTVQLVRVAHRMPMGGEHEGAVIAFQFHVIATLARGWGSSSLYRNLPGDFSLAAFERPHSRQAEVWLRADALDRPGSSEGYLQLGAPAPANLSGHRCGWPMEIALGEEFIALRDTRGGLYAFTGRVGDQSAPPLLIDFVYSPTQRAIHSLDAPPLIRIEGQRDPIYLRIRDALAANGRLRR